MRQCFDWAYRVAALFDSGGHTDLGRHAETSRVQMSPMALGLSRGCAFTEGDAELSGLRRGGAPWRSVGRHNHCGAVDRVYHNGASGLRPAGARLAAMADGWGGEGRTDMNCKAKGNRNERKSIEILESAGY